MIKMAGIFHKIIESGMSWANYFAILAGTWDLADKLLSDSEVLRQLFVQVPPLRRSKVIFIFCGGPKNTAPDV